MRIKTSFDRENAYDLAELSKLAYSDESNIRSYLEKYQVEYIEDAKTDTQCFTVVDDNSLIIVFRGTSNFEDWLTNLKFDKTHFNFNQHAGFYEAYQSVQSKIFNIVNKNKSKNIFVAGHSLGGALATLCAVDLHLLLQTHITACYTFGAPRTYDKASAKFIDGNMGSRIHNVVNNNDIVTHAPPEAMDFSHIGGRAYFEENGTLHVSEVFSWWQEKRYALAGRIDDLFELGTDGVKDHDINDYIDYL